MCNESWIKKAKETTWTKNKAIVKPFLRLLLSRYTLLYLSEKSRLAKSANRFSNTDFVIAIVAKQNKNKRVAQSVFSVMRG